MAPLPPNNAKGNFKREIEGGTNLTGLPNLRMFGYSGGYATLPDGTIVGIAKSILSACAPSDAHFAYIPHVSFMIFSQNGYLINGP